jgi:hypothetical protein
MASKGLTQCWRGAMAAKPWEWKLMGVVCGPREVDPAVRSPDEWCASFTSGTGDVQPMLTIIIVETPKDRMVARGPSSGRVRLVPGTIRLGHYGRTAVTLAPVPSSTPFVSYGSASGR